STSGQPVLIFDRQALDQFHARAGDPNFSTDRADVIRKMPYAPQGLKSLAIDAAEIASGKTITRSRTGGSSQWIDFAGQPGTVKTYHYSHVLPLRIVHHSGKRPWSVQAFGASASAYIDNLSERTRAAAETLRRQDQ